MDNETEEHSPNSNVKRLLVISSRARCFYQIQNALKPQVVIVQYKYESSALDDILMLVAQHLGDTQVDSIAFILHGTEMELFICGNGSKTLSVQSLIEQMSLREFFSVLVHNYLKTSSQGGRLDFLASHMNPQLDGGIVINEMESLLKIPVGLSKDLFGTDVKVPLTTDTEKTEVAVGSLYFDTDMLREITQKVGIPRQRNYNRELYEKIRTVGKGAFGTAVLYSRKEDDSLVVIKEINMHDLTASERQLALNEVKVLSMLDHPNIVTYFDSFEEDGILKIEMEYADGGTLAQYLAQRDKRLDEREVLILFHQIVSAIRHMHDYNVLHRDLKTANIFLTKEGIVKVGDFGISKMLTTKQAGANTVLGTPYYISPEMCEGKQYDEKSDVWALGCILYEMACLQKTFEGSNLPALVNKIMKGQFAPVKGNYSHHFKQLIRDLLQRDPEFRPTAAEILYERLPELLAQFSGDLTGAVDEEMMSAIENVQQRHNNTRSVVYNIRTFESSINLIPVPLPPRTKIVQLAVSSTHFVALTSELLVFTWGEDRRGQLGHGIIEPWRPRPECVSSLKGKSITRVCAGDGFSVFASNNGIVMTCGDGTSGCLGHGDWNCASKPKLLEKLLSVDVSSIACGPSHVVVVSGEGEVYSWGRGGSGRLGLGHEDDCCTPTQVTMPPEINIRNVKCGLDGTMFVTDSGGVLACGNNCYNKLGLNEYAGFLKNLLVRNDIEKMLVPTVVKSLSSYNVINISLGPNHTAVLVDPGHVVTFGRNSEGQLGRGHTRSQNGPGVVKSMMDKTSLMMECGETYTIVGTIENALYLWGTRYVMCAPTRPPTQDTNRAFTNYDSIDPRMLPESLRLQGNAETMQELGENGFTLIRETDEGSDLQNNNTNEFYPMNKFSPRPSARPLDPNLLPSKPGTAMYGPRMKDVILNPQEILALYASPAQISKGETVNLVNIHCQGQNIFAIVDTTAPLPKQGRRRHHHSKTHLVVGDVKKETNDKKDENKPEEKPEIPNSDMDTIGPVPEWLKEELENSDVPWPGADNNGPPLNQPSEGGSQVVNLSSGVSVIIGKDQAKSESEVSKAPMNVTRSPAELKHELERLRKAKGDAEVRLQNMEMEFVSKQKELHQETERKVKEREKVLVEEIERLRQELAKQTSAFQSYSDQIHSVQQQLRLSPQTSNSSRFCIIQ